MKCDILLRNEKAQTRAMKATANKMQTKSTSVENRISALESLLDNTNNQIKKLNNKHQSSKKDSIQLTTSNSCSKHSKCNMSTLAKNYNYNDVPNRYKDNKLTKTCKVQFSDKSEILEFNFNSPPTAIAKTKSKLKRSKKIVEFIINSPPTAITITKSKRKRSRKRKPNSVSTNRFFPNIINQEIHNLSETYQPTPLEKSVLSLGLNFIPTPLSSTKETMLAEFDDFANKIRMRKRLLHSRIDPTIRTSNVIDAFKQIKKSPSAIIESPLPANSPLEKFLAMSRFSLDEMLNKTTNSIKADIMSRQVRKAILSIKRNKEIVIKPSDKNLGVCIMDLNFYMKECYRQLNDKNSYIRYENPPDYKGIFATLKRILFKYSFLYNKDSSLTSLAKFLLQPLLTNVFKIGKFYILPKVHKPEVVGRPIVNCIETFASFTSQLLDKLLQPIMKSFKTYIKDSNQLILHLDNLKFHKDIIFYTADVVNLYPSIDIDAGLIELAEALNLSKTANPNFILELTKWTLKNNYFTFDDKIFKQTKGVAMGQSIAVSFACIYMSMLEMKCFKKCKSLRPSFQSPLYFKRYIDDIFSIWISKSDAEFFHSEMNKKMHPNIELTSSISSFSCIFLDVQIFKGSNFSHSSILDVVLYQKPINKYQYIPYSSYHTKYVFKSFISSELNRYICKCTSPLDFLSIKRQFYFRLIRRGYPDRYLKSIFDKFPSDLSKLAQCRKQRLQSLKDAYAASKDNSTNEIPLVYKTVYNPIHKQINLRKIITPSEDSPINFDPDWPQLTNHKNPILCFKNSKRLGGFLQ
jgi:hypothetical protein